MNKIEYVLYRNWLKGTRY